MRTQCELWLEERVAQELLRSQEENTAIDMPWPNKGGGPTDPLFLLFYLLLPPSMGQTQPESTGQRSRVTQLWRQDSPKHRAATLWWREKKCREGTEQPALTRAALFQVVPPESCQSSGSRNSEWQAPLWEARRVTLGDCH